jgi:hypothetical protein
MDFQKLRVDAAYRGPCRPQLGQNVDAVAVILNHVRDASHLTFNSVEPIEQLGLIPIHTQFLEFASAGAKTLGARI